MLSIKNESGNRKQNRALRPLCFLVFVALGAVLAGCGPAGTRALLKGQRLLDQGDYSDAADEFKSATDDMATNAQAWNYLGVAEQHAGQLDEAAKAYERALELDRDLTAAHFNLGCLWMQEDKPDKAASEFTAYTLRRVNEPEGWLKLGLAQLRNNDLLPAEKSFSTALYLNPNNAEALNGLGLARMDRGRPQEAQKFFQAAVQFHPDFAPAVLNLATVEHQYLHNDKLALEEYRAYLSLNPRPADWNQVNAIVASLGQTSGVDMASPPPTRPPPSTWQQNPAAIAQAQPAYEPPRQEERQQERRREHRVESPRAESNNNAQVEPADTSRQPTETVEVQPENRVASAPPSSSLKPANEPQEFRSIQPIPPASQSEGGGFFHWFRSEPEQSSMQVTPLPAQNIPPAAAPVHIVAPAPPVFPRYLYLSPQAPAAGDRRAASVMFARARDYEAERKFADALDAYRRAARSDPSWFEAQYNCGVMAYRLRDYQFSLESYEIALAIEPDSSDARYNFALALKAAGYVTDAVDELKRILTANPNDARAHLELGNLYAQKLQDVPRARAEYLKVLQLDPGNPQASNIEFWLSANPP